MTHEEIVAALHREHLAHLGEDPDIVEDCAPCAMYAEWVARLQCQGCAASVYDGPPVTLAIPRHTCGR